MSDQHHRQYSCTPCKAGNSDTPKRNTGSAKDHLLLKDIEKYFPLEIRNSTIPDGTMMIFKNGSWNLMTNPTKKVKNSDRPYLMFDSVTKTICIEK